MSGARKSNCTVPFAPPVSAAAARVSRSHVEAQRCARRSAGRDTAQRLLISAPGHAQRQKSSGTRLRAPAPRSCGVVGTTGSAKTRNDLTANAKEHLCSLIRAPRLRRRGKSLPFASPRTAARAAAPADASQDLSYTQRARFAKTPQTRARGTAASAAEARRSMSR